MPTAFVRPRTDNSASIHIRYGIMSFRSRDFVHNLGVGLGAPLAAGHVAVTAGVYNPVCSAAGCGGHFMAAIEFEQNLVSLALGRPDESGNLDLSLMTGMGLGTPSDTTMLSGSAAVFASVAPRVSGTRLYPFVGTGLGFGLTNDDSGTDAGMLPLLSAGAGLLTSDDRLGVTAGVHRAFLRGGNWLAGVNFRLGLSRSRRGAAAGGHCGPGIHQCP
jgi:hypothetical protein